MTTLVKERTEQGYSNEISKGEEKENQKRIDYSRLFLLRMRDHQLSQVVPLDLPSIQGVTFVQTTDDDNNNKECITITGDLKLDPEFYEEAEDGEMIQQEKDEWDE